MLIAEGQQRDRSPLSDLCDDAVTATAGVITSRRETGFVKVTHLCWRDDVKRVVYKFHLCEKLTHVKRVKRNATHMIYRSRNLIQQTIAVSFDELSSPFRPELAEQVSFSLFHPVQDDLIADRARNKCDNTRLNTTLRRTYRAHAFNQNLLLL